MYQYGWIPALNELKRTTNELSEYILRMKHIQMSYSSAYYVLLSGFSSLSVCVALYGTFKSA